MGLEISLKNLIHETRDLEIMITAAAIIIIINSPVPPAAAPLQGTFDSFTAQQ